MTEQPTPTPHSTFTVSSGCLCYGDLHNMYHGMTVPTQPFPSAVERHPGGTVKAQILQYNTAALNGTWRAYELVNTSSEKCTAWFVCHDSVDPVPEVDKILRVSGSPYENDRGSQWHCDETVREGVLPINRYDWGYYDRRCEDKVPVLAGGDDFVGVYMSLGLVDHSHAEEYIRLWQGLPDRQRESQPHGLWMGVPEEYMFGRFGFTDDHEAARSFLWFTGDTNFAFTAFAGMETTKTLRVFETEEDWMSRILREGRDMQGLELLQPAALEQQFFRRIEAPPESELRGPYPAAEYIMDAQDAHHMVAATTTHVQLSAYWRGACLEVLNEAMMSFLDVLATVTSIGGPGADETGVVVVGIESVAAWLFPEHGNENTVDGWMHEKMVRPKPTAMTSRVAFADRITAFLKSRAGSSDNRSLVGMLRVVGFAEGLAAAMEYLCFEILELAGNCAGDNYRKGAIVPQDIRRTILNDAGLMAKVGCSRVFWKGGSQGWVDASQEV